MTAANDTKRPCQNVLIQGEPMCKFVATWSVQYTTAGGPHERHYCEHHVRAQLEQLYKSDSSLVVHSVGQVIDRPVLI